MSWKSARPSRLSHPLGKTSSPSRPGGGSGSRIQESPRVPVRLPSPSRLKSIGLSPLIDHNSPLSLPESEHARLKWLNRFTPRWNESKDERLARFKLRALKMRTRRAHTEKLLNSFQRLDAFTGTILPSDLMISFSFFKWAPSRESPPESEQQQQQQQHHHHQQQSRPAGKSKKGREDGPGAYLTPNRILHPYWVSKKAGMSVWILCHQDILKHRKKLRPLYRFTHEPKFSPHLADQIASQLVRRVAQESVVLRASLGRPRSGTVASLDHLVGAARPGTTARISEHPAVASGPVLLSYLKSLLPSSPAGPEDPGPPVGQDLPDPSASLGAILVKSSSLFRQLAALQSPEGSSPAPLSTKQGPAERQDALLFSLDLRDGPVPVWDLEGLLARMAKPPPRAASGTPLVTAAVGGPSTVSAETSLAAVLAGQIDEALRGPGCPLTADPGAYLVPLAERTYPLILALRRATWWLGQGFEPAHFAAIRSMLDEALARKHLRHTQWLHWIRSRNTVEGKIKRNGQLWVPFETRSGTPRKLWRRV
ncbi:hypothetical protein PtB15_17B268 [Puccinia triticina]|nr:hypothetical protein PtB15_17B268 [Puccinia triticina]